MLLSNVVVMRWNAKNKKYFESLGYKYTKMKDEFLVKVNDLKPYSMAKIYVSCDYCGRIYQTNWASYYKGHMNSNKDSCSNASCTGKKAKDVVADKYGGVGFAVDEIKNKVEQTNLQKYGVKNVFASPDIQEKIRKTNLERYGVEVPTQNPEIKEKATQTNLEKYGEVSYGVIWGREHKGELSPTWKGGVEYHRVERATYEYRIWRKAVFDRDAYTCQCCGDKSGKSHAVTLEAHHIKNWNDNLDCRYDVDNGTTLCRRCHLVFHFMYGKQNNAKEQLEEFINNYNSDKKVC